MDPQDQESIDLRFDLHRITEKLISGLEERRKMAGFTSYRREIFTKTWCCPYSYTLFKKSSWQKVNEMIAELLPAYKINILDFQNVFIARRNKMNLFLAATVGNANRPQSETLFKIVKPFNV